MDKVKKYEKYILSMLEPYAQIKYSNLDAQNQLIADRKNHRYQIVTIGRDREGRYIHGTPIHLDIVDGKIWIQWNMTEIDFGRELTDRGVPKSDIVIGFLAPEIREYSDYAVA